MSHLSDVIYALQETQGSKAKQAILEKERDAGNLLLATYLNAAYEPRFNYYLTALNLKKYMDERNMLSTVTVDRTLDIKLINELIENLSQRKLTGGAAKAWVANVYTGLHFEEAPLLEYLIDGDIRASVSGTMINKVWPNLVSYTAYQRCSLPKDVDLDKWFLEDLTFAQTKADGTFTYFNVDESKSFTVTSRQGKPYPTEPFYTIAQQLSRCVLMPMTFSGELLVKDALGKVQPRQVGNGMLNALAQGEDLPAGYEVVYAVWDVVPTSTMVKNGKNIVPYSARLAMLQQLLDSNEINTPAYIIETDVVKSFDEAVFIYRRHLAAGEEGIILKRGLGEWKDGSSKDQVKFKLAVPVDLVCTGFRESVKGKHMKTFGSMLFQTSDGLLEVGVSGFKDEEREKINADRGAWIGTVSTITANAWLAPLEGDKGMYSLYLPRFTERRFDKDVADTLEQVQWQFANAVA